MTVEESSFKSEKECIKRSTASFAIMWGDWGRVPSVALPSRGKSASKEKKKERKKRKRKKRKEKKNRKKKKVEPACGRWRWLVGVYRPSLELLLHCCQGPSRFLGQQFDLSKILLVSRSWVVALLVLPSQWCVGMSTEHFSIRATCRSSRWRLSFNSCIPQNENEHFPGISNRRNLFH